MLFRSDIQLIDNDIVVINYRKNTISVDSSVVRPGKYEAIKGETLKDVINYAGGLKSHASNRLLINRIAPLKDRSSNEIDNKSFYIDYSDSDNFFAQDGDKIIARKMMLSSRQVELIGQVKSPGVYSFYEGMTLFDLIQLGSGFSDSTFFNSVYKNKAEIIRRNPQNRYEKIINIKVEDVADPIFFVRTETHDPTVRTSDLSTNTRIRERVDLTTEEDQELELLIAAFNATDKNPEFWDGFQFFLTKAPEPPGNISIENSPITTATTATSAATPGRATAES
mgnify:CR=1 FL=1